MTEIWKPMPQYPKYLISNTGRVYSEKTKQEIHPFPDKRGYLRFHAKSPRKGRKVIVSLHRTVAEMYIPNPDGKEQVNHKDGDKNNNSVENLEWVTGTENIRHAFANNLIRTRKPVVQLTKNGEFIRTYQAVNKAARELGLTDRIISEICKGGRRYKSHGGFKWKYCTALVPVQHREVYLVK